MCRIGGSLTNNTTVHGGDAGPSVTYKLQVTTQTRLKPENVMEKIDVGGCLRNRADKGNTTRPIGLSKKRLARKIACLQIAWFGEKMIQTSFNKKLKKISGQLDHTHGHSVTVTGPQRQFCNSAIAPSRCDIFQLRRARARHVLELNW
jgi:hypothetical protein